MSECLLCVYEYVRVRESKKDCVQVCICVSVCERKWRGKSNNMQQVKKLKLKTSFTDTLRQCEVRWQSVGQSD